MKTIEKVTDFDYGRINETIQNTSSSGIAIPTVFVYSSRRLAFPNYEHNDFVNSERLVVPEESSKKMFYLQVKGLRNITCPYAVASVKYAIRDEMDILLEKFKSIILDTDNLKISCWAKSIYQEDSNDQRVKIVGNSGSLDYYNVEYDLIHYNAKSINELIPRGCNIVVDADCLKRRLFGSPINPIIDAFSGSDNLHVISSDPESIEGYARRKKYPCNITR